MTSKIIRFHFLFNRQFTMPSIDSRNRCHVDQKLLNCNSVKQSNNKKKLTQFCLFFFPHFSLIFYYSIIFCLGNIEPNINDIIQNLPQFVMTPALRDMTYRCRITRDKKGVDRGIYPTYYLHLEQDQKNRVTIYLF